MNKAKAMPDFGDDEWAGMVCIETVNAAKNTVELAAGATHSMTARVRVI
jgi:glucose-6-phosphate 1-epimerase